MNTDPLMKIGLALLIMLVTLSLVERYAPQYADVYLILLIAGVALANSAGLSAFLSDLQGRLS